MCDTRVVTKHAISLLSPDLSKHLKRISSEKAMYDGYMLTSGMFVLSKKSFVILDAHDKISNT